MDWKKLGKKLISPPLWLILLLVALSAACLVGVFTQGLEKTAAAYLVYVLSFYTLCVATAYCVLELPKRYTAIKAKLYSHKLTQRYMTDRAFRTWVSLHISLGVNLLYAALNVLLWFVLGSWWFVVLAGYYAILSVMRFLMVRYVHRNALGSSVLEEWKRTRVCAWIMLAINITLTGAVLMMLFQDRGYDYSGILIYVMAMYTFYSVIHAIVDMIRFRKEQSPIFIFSKVVSLSAALVSMLNLETAMFAQFGEKMSQQDQKLMIALTGAGISAAVIALSVVVIRMATKKIKEDRYGE